MILCTTCRGKGETFRWHEKSVVKDICEECSGTGHKSVTVKVKEKPTKQKRGKKDE